MRRWPPSYGGRVKAFAVYSGGRVLVLLALAALLYLAGMRGMPLAAAAVLISLPVSYVVLSGPRNAMGVEVERRIAARRAHQEDLRLQLRGDDDTESPAG